MQGFRICFALGLLFILASGTSRADTLQSLVVSGVPQHTLGEYSEFLIEEEKPLTLETVLALQGEGKFRLSSQPAPNFGIAPKPVWLHLSINNDMMGRTEQFLYGATSWLDYIDVYHIHDGMLVSQFHTGDEIKGVPWLTPSLGYAFPLQLEPGRNEIFMHVAAEDPVSIPLLLADRATLENIKIKTNYFYGFFYGFLVALGIYNLLLYFGIRERSHLYYSLTLLSSVALNLSYTGHGVAWLWPEQQALQRYEVLWMMLIYNLMGWLFADRFLMLKRTAPRVRSLIFWIAGSMVAGLFLSTLFGFRAPAAHIAFISMAVFTLTMFWLGVLSVARNLVVGRYFLFATFFAMLGVGITLSAVWGLMPLNTLTFHASEIGMMMESTLFALALSYRLRQHQKARDHAEMMAHQDELTKLGNRRHFMELAISHTNPSDRRQHPSSLILMDIDHFKSINDRFGHKTGDDTLVIVSDLLRQYCRNSDILARWGGEEFILLLPETTLDQAVRHAERIRLAISDIRVPAGKDMISLTASFGVVQNAPGQSLEKLISQADAHLYRAKESGRNQVCA